MNASDSAGESASSLFLTEKEPAPQDREMLLRRWYRLNAIRMALLGTAWLASEHARRR